MQDSAGEVRTNSWAIYSCGSLHMDEERLNDILEPIYNISILIQDMLYTHIHADICRKIMTTAINERTHFFIKIYLSHFIRKGWCFFCVWGELEAKTDCHILTPSSFDHSSPSFAFWLGCSTVGPEGASPLSGARSHSGILSPTGTATQTQTDPTRLGNLVI